jgi:hypothetical protein
MEPRRFDLTQKFRKASQLLLEGFITKLCWVSFLVSEFCPLLATRILCSWKNARPPTSNETAVAEPVRTGATTHPWIVILQAKVIQISSRRLWTLCQVLAVLSPLVADEIKEQNPFLVLLFLLVSPSYLDVGRSCIDYLLVSFRNIKDVQGGYVG